ncbi:MAG: LacI family DNA-binding transcriptional regulator [Candidatus Goldbacteria bacterium]|nr:LacI family DNA-binding transcriptional regulator [Candidatus Goldiibacteriota bacterium]HPD18778.1 LacI family DNA-binding transcriptional regulator [Candidatus Goldiibacteriota bacterium]
MKRVTIKDIAKSLGVAYSTVSMAMSGDKTISEKMKKKVRKKAAEMGYYPNRSARNLVKGYTNNIAVVTPGLFSLYEMNIIRGMEKQMVNSRYDLILHTSRYDWQEVHNEMRKVMYEQTADAVIIIGVVIKDELINEFKKAKTPLINVDGGLLNATCDLNIDNVYCGKIAAEHFIKIGRKKPALILGNTKFAYSQAARLRGYRDTLKKHGIKLSDSFIYESPLYLPDDLRQIGFKTAEILIDRGADAIYCSSGDYVAQGVLRYCSYRGIKVPEEVSIIGTDNFDVAEALNLSTIEQPLMEMGQRAFEVAEKAVRDKKFYGKSEFFKPRLIIRNT